MSVLTPIACGPFSAKRQCLQSFRKTYVSSTKWASMWRDWTFSLSVMTVAIAQINWDLPESFFWIRMPSHLMTAFRLSCLLNCETIWISLARGTCFWRLDGKVRPSPCSRHSHAKMTAVSCSKLALASRMKSFRSAFCRRHQLDFWTRLSGRKKSNSSLGVAMKISWPEKR